MNPPTLSTSTPLLGQHLSGYSLAILPTVEAREQIIAVRERFVGINGVWLTPVEHLHCTVITLTSYSDPQHAPFNTAQRSMLDRALVVAPDVLADIAPFTVTFDRVRLTPDAVIMTGHDSGSLEKVRNKFKDSVDLSHPAARPPQIIHMTLGRFTEAIDVSGIQTIADSLDFSIPITVTSLSLGQHTIHLPQFTIEELQEFPLATVKVALSSSSQCADRD